MDEPRSSSEAYQDVIQKFFSYGPLAVAALVLLVQAFSPGLLIRVPLPATLAFVVGGLVFLVLHVEVVLSKSKKATKRLDEKIVLLASTQKSLLDSQSVLAQTTLGIAFSFVTAESPRVGHLRIFAISSQQIINFVKFNEIRIDRCDILIRSFPQDDEEHSRFLTQIRLVVEDWKMMKAENKITELNIRYYDFFPTEYECIFDASHLIFGLYDSVPGDYSGVSVREPLLIRGSSSAGKSMITEFKSRFDKLFETCVTHHGPENIDEELKNVGN